MRTYYLPATVVAGVLLLSTPAGAQTRGGQFEGFGGLTFGSTTSATTFGAGVAVPAGDHLQIIGEAGRLTDITSSLLDAALDLTPADLRMSAWYAEGGVRLAASRRAPVRPYIEGTAGVARLTAGIHDAGEFGAIANTALAFLGTTEPLVGIGGGVMVQGGPVLLDLGYRYKKIFAGSGLASVFSLGDDGFDVSQVRVGIGIRF